MFQFDLYITLTSHRSRWSPLTIDFFLCFILILDIIGFILQNMTYFQGIIAVRCHVIRSFVTITMRNDQQARVMVTFRPEQVFARFFFFWTSNYLLCCLVINRFDRMTHFYVHIIVTVIVCVWATQLICRKTVEKRFHRSYFALATLSLGFKIKN